MKFRVALASLLAVILLSMSSAASICEIKCDLAQTIPICHGNAVQQKPAGQMTDMPGMDHMAATESDNANKALVQIAPNCHAHACAQQPAALIKQRAPVAHATLCTEPIILDSSRFAPEPVIAELSSRGPPRFRLATPVSLHTTLRV